MAPCFPPFCKALSSTHHNTLQIQMCINAVTKLAEILIHLNIALVKIFGTTYCNKLYISKLSRKLVCERLCNRCLAKCIIVPIYRNLLHPLLVSFRYLYFHQGYFFQPAYFRCQQHCRRKDCRFHRSRHP